MKRTVAASWIVRLGLAVALVVIALVAALPVIPPNAVPASAPESTFSAQRAMEDLEVVAKEPHPIGSTEQERVRDYIVEQAQALGLSTDVKRAEVGAGRVAENIIVRMPGTENSPRDVLITAHYDSAPPSPGAGDNGVSVAAMLESMRVLEAGEPLENDVVFLFTDGEELGKADGAEAFINRHPAAEGIGVAFIFDSEPDSFTTDMRTTSPGDAWLVRQLAVASPPIFANSATNASDRSRFGNDFAAFPPAGITSAEFLLEGSVVRYHTPRDIVRALDPTAVQDHGDTMLALARHFGNLDLKAARSTGEDLVFFTAPALGLVAYPIWLAKVLAIAAVSLFIAVIVAARGRGNLSLARLALGALAFLAVLVVGAALAVAVWEVVLLMHPESAETLHFPDFEGSRVAMAAIFAVAAAAFVAVTQLLSRWIGAHELATGALAWLAVLALALAFFEPLFSTVALWPLFGGVVALAVVAFILGRGWVAGALLALTAVPGLVLCVPLLVFEALKPEEGAVVGVASLILLLGSLLPQLLLITGRFEPSASGTTRPGSGGQPVGVPVRTNPPPSGRSPGLSGGVRGRDA